MRFLVVLVMLAACGGDDGGSSSGQRVTCKASLTGAVTLTDEACRVFLCTTPDYQDLDISEGTVGGDTNYQLIPSLTAPDMFTARSYSLADLRPLSTDFHVTANSKQYMARAVADRSADESATVTLSKVLPAVGNDNCSGAAVGTMAITMVEIEFTPNGAVIGPGRIQASVTLTEK